MIKLGAKELRTTSPQEEVKNALKKNNIYIIIDNVLDTYNIGSIFRLADAVAAQKVFLCGSSETPPNTRIKKASINTTEWVPWEYNESTHAVIKNLREQVENIQIIAIEQDQRSTPYQKVSYTFPVAFIIGNETSGINADTLNLADTIVELPMYGVNKSLNVMVSLAIVMFRAIS